MSTSKKKKNTTIDDLATMVARGFEGQDKKFTNEFSKIDKRFEQQAKRIDNRFEQQDLWISKRLYEQEERFNKRIEEFDRKYDNIMTGIDRLAKILETYYQEHLALGVKVDRHEEWIRQVAEKMGIQLKY